MSDFVNIHAELASIMDILAKSAVAEISRLVDDGAAFLRLEISRSHREVAVLRRKLQLMESELRTARKAAAPEQSSQSRCVTLLGCGVMRGDEREQEFSPPAESDVGQDWSFSLWRDGAPTPVEKSSGMEEARPESLLIKQERLEEDVCYSEPQPTPAGEEQVTEPTPAGHPEEQVAQPTPVEEEKKQETGPTPAGDPEELREQHRCGHSDEELSGLEFVVKAEQEEEHVAQRLSQTGCEHSARRLNNLGSEYVMYERDSQLWTSFTQGDSDIETADPVCSNAAEQYSQSLSVHSELQHTPATVEGSGNTVSSFGAAYVEAFDKMRIEGGGAEAAERPVFEKNFIEEENEQKPTPEEEEQISLRTPVEEEKKQETGPTPAGDPEELREQHRCGHSDEELSGLEFVVKAEQEEEHVAQRLSQTGCEHSAGRLNNLGSEYVMYERDSQLWTSFTQGDSDIETADPVCSNAVEQYSQSLSVHSELQHTPATVEGSGNTVSSFGAAYVEAFDKMSEKPSVCSEEL
ncbi:hypothetical protein JZ751_018677, partial [Albula glossodonta]